MLRVFGFDFSPSLAEAITSKNIDITKIYKFIERDREIAWIQIDGSCYKKSIIPFSKKLN